MTNFEFYKEKLLDIKGRVAIKGGEPCACNNIHCNECGRSDKCFDVNLIEWLLLEHIEENVNYKICKNLKVDDKILVSDTGNHWIKRHFAGYDAQRDSVIAFDAGVTSWSVDNEKNVTRWRYVKLPEEVT